MEFSARCISPYISSPIYIPEETSYFLCRPDGTREQHRLTFVVFRTDNAADDEWEDDPTIGRLQMAVLGDDDEEKTDASFGFKTMLLLSVATSIDALAVGVSFAFLGVNIIAAIATIGTTTFILSIVGIKVGNVFGAKYKDKAELVGGIILILMGLKILLEHLGVISF